MLEPITIICCTKGEVERGKIFKHYLYNSADEAPERWTLSIYFANGAGDIEMKAFKLLDRAWRWYRAYMEWEDENSDTEHYGQQN